MQEKKGMVAYEGMGNDERSEDSVLQIRWIECMSQLDKRLLCENCT